MKRPVVFIVLTGLLFFTTSNSYSQSTHQHISPPTDSLSGTATGDILNGIKYFIRIVPIDSSRKDKMPMYQPRGNQAEFMAVDTEPIPVKQVQPEYPLEAREKGLDGIVWVRCLIGEDGKVKKAEAVRANAEIFVAPAIAAAMQWRFKPATLKGKPVAVWASIPFRFRLKK